MLLEGLRAERESSRGGGLGVGVGVGLLGVLLAVYLWSAVI